MNDATTQILQGVHLMIRSSYSQKCAISVALLARKRTSYLAHSVENPSIPTVCRLHHKMKAMTTKWMIGRLSPSSNLTGSVSIANSVNYAPQPLRKHTYFTVTFATRLSTLSVLLPLLNRSPSANGNVKNVLNVKVVVLAHSLTLKSILSLERIN